jgi:hypothetical protein
MDGSERATQQPFERLLRIMIEKKTNHEPPKRVWPWLLLAGVILWIAVSVFWVWKEVQRIKRQKITAIELPNATHPHDSSLSLSTWVRTDWEIRTDELRNPKELRRPKAEEMSGSSTILG